MIGLKSALSLTALALALSASASAAGNTIKIGALFPLSGDVAKLGEANKNGLRLAVDEINAAGGIASMGGAKIELVWGDTQGKPEIGIGEVTRLVEQEKVSAIVGCFQSSVTLPATQAAERLGVPFLDNIATSDKITERGFKYTFRICPKASWYAKDQVGFVKDLKALTGKNVTKVALLHENTDFGESTAAGQKKYLQEAGIQVLIEVKYSASAPDLTTEVAKVKAVNPDVVLTVVYLNDAVLIARAREAMGMTKIPFIDAAGGTIDPQFLKQLGKTAEGWITEVEFTKFAPGANVLNDKYFNAFGEDITGDSAYAYQAGWVIGDALQRAASSDRNMLRNALAKMDMPAGKHMILPTNHIFFDNTGQNPNAPLFVVQVQNGTMVPVWPAKYAAKKVQM